MFVFVWWYNIYMEKEKLYTPKQVCEILGIHIRTLQNWDKKGKIKIIRTPSNRRKVRESEINKILGDINKESNNRTVIYARVSSYEQKTKGDLDRQIGYITHKLSMNNITDVIVVTDVGSGLNDKREGLTKVMDMAKNGDIKMVAITYKERLTRFGFNYLETYFNNYGVKINILKNVLNDKSPQEELVEDLMSIIASFSGKLYGSRSHKNKRVINETKEIITDALNLQNKNEI